MNSKLTKCFLLSLIILIISISMAYAVEVDVENIGEFKEACLDSNATIIRLQGDITITDTDYNSEYYIDVEDSDRTIDLNGYFLNITKDLGSEYGVCVRFKKSNRSFTITNSKSDDDGGIDVDSSQIPFKFYNATDCTNDNIELNNLTITTSHYGSMISSSSNGGNNLYIENVSVTNNGCTNSQFICTSGFSSANIENFTYNKYGNNCYFQFAPSADEFSLNDSLGSGQNVYYKGSVGCIKQHFDDEAKLDDIFLPSNNYDFDMVVIKKFNPSPYMYVSTYNELREALITPEIVHVYLSDDIVVDSNKNLIININDLDRDIELRGHSIVIQNKEHFEINYWTNDSFVFRDGISMEKDTAGKIVSNCSEDATYLFNVNNKGNVEEMPLTFREATFSTTATELLLGCNGLNLNLMSGYYGASSFLFFFGYDTDMIIEIGAIEIFNAMQNESYSIAFSPNYSAIGDDLVSDYLKDEKRLFIVDEDSYGNREYSDVTDTQKLGDSCGGLQLMVVLNASHIPADIDLPSITNISVDESTGVVSWDEFEEADKYDFTFYTYGGFLDGDVTEKNLREICISSGWTNATYTFSIYAIDSSRNQISKKMKCTYTFVSDNPQLNTPSNPYWDGMTAKWSHVVNAERYEVTVRSDMNESFYVETDNNYYDFSEDIRLSTEKEYRFCVRALANGYPTSLNSVYSGYTSGWFEKGYLQNVSISEDGVLSWDEYPGASNYSYTIYTGGGSANGTSVNLKEKAKIFEYPSGMYNVSVYAVDSHNNAISYEWIGYYTYLSSMVGDLDGNEELNIIDVRLMLQNVINGVDSEEVMLISDLNDDDEIDIIDVRLLLQMVINNA